MILKLPLTLIFINSLSSIQLRLAEWSKAPVTDNCYWSSDVVMGSTPKPANIFLFFSQIIRRIGGLSLILFKILVIILTYFLSVIYFFFTSSFSSDGYNTFGMDLVDSSQYGGKTFVSDKVMWFLQVSFVFIELWLLKIISRTIFSTSPSIKIGFFVILWLNISSYAIFQ